MKLTSIKKKLFISINDSISAKCFDETFHLVSYDIRGKILDEICPPNGVPISGIQIRIINNLKNEIN